MKDLLKALEIAESHLEKGEWATIRVSENVNVPVYLYVGAVHRLSDGTHWRESHIVHYMIKDGVVRKHASM